MNMIFLAISLPWSIISCVSLGFCFIAWAIPRLNSTSNTGSIIPRKAKERPMRSSVKTINATANAGVSRRRSNTAVGA